MLHLFVLLVAVASLGIEAKHLPPYVKSCRKDDPNLNQCAKDRAREVIPAILKGDKQFHLQPLSPMHLDSITIKAGNNLVIGLHNVVLKGLENCVLDNINIDLDKKHIGVTVSFNWINIEAQYNMDGKLLILSLKGEGPANLTFDDLTVNYSFDYKLIKKDDGKEYIDPDIKPSVDYKIRKSHYYFGNLFNGDKELGERTNKILNENGAQLHEDLGTSVSETIGVIVTNILQLYLATVPYDEIFV